MPLLFRSPSCGPEVNLNENHRANSRKPNLRSGIRNCQVCHLVLHFSTLIASQKLHIYALVTRFNLPIFTEFRVLNHERNFQICKNREENWRGKRSLFSNLGRIPPFLLCCHLMNNWWDIFPESQLCVFCLSDISGEKDSRNLLIVIWSKCIEGTTKI